MTDKNGVEPTIHFGGDHAVRSLVALLTDEYKQGGGRTMVRELVQNADDARASRVVLIRLERGPAGSANPLLDGPALLVVNDGAFSQSNQQGLHAALGGDKTADDTKIGRFGLGLKSVFHYCEAFLYLGRGSGARLLGAVNPYHLPQVGDRVEPNWVECGTPVEKTLTNWLDWSVGVGKAGLLLWLPLRILVPGIRGKSLSTWRADGDSSSEAGMLPPHAEQLGALAMLLAQCQTSTRICHRIASPTHATESKCRCRYHVRARRQRTGTHEIARAMGAGFLQNFQPLRQRCPHQSW